MKASTRQAVFDALKSGTTRLSSELLDDSASHSGTGLINVFMRLQLQFHRSDIYDITDGENGTGTKFIIKVPNHV